MHIFDGEFNGAARSEMYRSQIVPDLFPHEAPMLLENWTQEDLEMYVGGGFTPGYAFKTYKQRHVMGDV